MSQKKIKEFEKEFIELLKKFNIEIKEWVEPNYCENEYCDASGSNFMFVIKQAEIDIKTIMYHLKYLDK